MLGFCSEFGIGVSVNYPKAVEYYLKAANEDELLAQARLVWIGKMNYPGIPLGEIDWEYWWKTVNEEHLPEKLTNWLLQYKDNDSVQFCLGNCFIFGLGAKKDPY